jgi:starvation-inducible DNA-binding protein
MKGAVAEQGVNGMHRTKNDMPEERRRAVVEMLNNRLADALDLRDQAKQAHWNVKGPMFFELHKLFDEVAAAMTEHSDEIAERAVALGGTAEGTVRVVAQRTQLPAYPLDIYQGPDHVDALSTALATFGKAVREGIDQADELGDKDTADLFTEISRDVDKFLWFVEAHNQAEH